jgi:hypothetical protein
MTVSGRIDIAVDLPGTRVFVVPALFPYKAHNIRGRIAQEKSDFMGEFPALAEAPLQMLQASAERKRPFFRIAEKAKGFLYVPVQKGPLQHPRVIGNDQHASRITFQYDKIGSAVQAAEQLKEAVKTRFASYYK